MERLIHSNSISSKPHSIAPVRPRLGRVDSPRVFSPATTSLRLLPRSELRRANPLSSKLNYDCSEKNLCLSEDFDGGSKPDKSKFVELIARRFSQSKKVCNAGSIILLSAIFLTLFHPAIVSPAFAKAGAPAAVATGRALIRTELLSSAWAGLFAGCLHTLSGPDHLAALAPLSIGRTRLQSAAVGALWGCGHDAGQLIFGLLFLLLKDRLHIEIIRTWGTRVVGFTLLVIGAMGIKESSEIHDSEYGEALASPSKKKVGFATFATGIVHGLQPDALMMILPALALPSRLAGAAFLFMFLVGTVIAMGSYTVFIGSCSQALKDRVPRITEKLTLGSSLVAIGLGIAILISQSFGFSLY